MAFDPARLAAARGTSRSRFDPARLAALRDAPADISPSAPPPDSNYEVAARSQSAPGGTPYYVPPINPESSLGLGDALLTNKPTGLLGSVARSSPAMAAAAMGAAAGAPLGPLGIVGGAALGGFGAEISRQNAVQGLQLARGEDVTPASEAVTRATSEGIAQGAGAGVGLAGGAIGRAVGPSLARVGGQALRITTGVPAKYGEAVLSDMAMLGRAPSQAGVREAYRSFEDAAGLQSPKLGRELAGKLESPAQAVRVIEDAKQSLAGYIDYDASRNAGTIIYDKAKLLADVQAGKLEARYLGQQLYDASQAGSYLKRLAKAGSPTEAANQAGIGEFTNNANDLIESLFPQAGYGSARTAAFERSAADQFSSFFPLNANQSPNALRGYAGVMTAANAPLLAAYTGSAIPLAGLAAPIVQSPAVAGAAIKTANAVGAIAPGVYRAAPGTLAEAYMNRRAQPAQ